MSPNSLFDVFPTLVSVTDLGRDILACFNASLAAAFLACFLLVPVPSKTSPSNSTKHQSVLHLYFSFNIYFSRQSLPWAVNIMLCGDPSALVISTLMSCLNRLRQYKGLD